VNPPDTNAGLPREHSGILGALTTLGRDLAGVLRPRAIVEHLAQSLTAQFSPEALGIAIFDLEANRLQVLYAFPGPSEWLTAALDDAMRGGPRATSIPGTLLSEDGPVPAGTPAHWIAAPLVARRIVNGSVVVGRNRSGFSQDDVLALEAFSALASQALESGQIIEQAESGKQSWAQTVDAVSFAICLVDELGRVRRANRAFAELVTASASEVVGRPWVALVPPGWIDGIESALESPGQEVDLRVGPRSFSVTAFASFQKDSAMRVLVFLDRTERRRLQDQLIQSEKMSAVGQLVAGVAHDLNNPLASVLGFADFLVESPDVPAHLREPLRVIQQESLRAATIVRNLLGFARKQEHRRHNETIRSVLEATLVLLRNQLMADRVDVHLEIDPGLPELYVNANQIQQVFVNLIHNASQAIASTGNPGEIRITARHGPQGVVIDVSDNGPGMPEELAARAFEPFFTTKPEGQGTGLGLNICHGIVKEHGGHITLTTAPGAGATFSVELPLREPSAEESPLPARTDSPTMVFRVLLIDDEPHILHYLRTTLEAWGHSVESAPDGHTALEMATTGHFDLIISDLRMPRLGGREFYEQLILRNPPVAQNVVFSTGDTIRGDTREFLEREGRPYLNKPFSLAELRNLLQQIATQRTLPSSSA
jgi:signal transduction histidine kinase/ActR/RegA family two-component response regulator